MITDFLKISHSVLLAGMNVAADLKLAVTVINADSFDVIREVDYTSIMLKKQIQELKKHLNDKNAS